MDVSIDGESGRPESLHHNYSRGLPPLSGNAMRQQHTERRKNRDRGGMKNTTKAEPLVTVTGIK